MGLLTEVYCIKILEPEKPIFITDWSPYLRPFKAECTVLQPLSIFFVQAGEAMRRPRSGPSTATTASRAWEAKRASSTRMMSIRTNPTGCWKGPDSWAWGAKRPGSWAWGAKRRPELGPDTSHSSIKIFSAIDTTETSTPTKILIIIRSRIGGAPDSSEWGANSLIN